MHNVSTVARAQSISTPVKQLMPSEEGGGAKIRDELGIAANLKHHEP
jgi:hypothetical protein